MRKSIYYIFTAASFALLVSTTGRFAYGLILILEFNILLCSGFLFSGLVKKINIANLDYAVTLSSIIFSAVLYKLILVLISPVLALTLSFSIFMPAVSAFLIGNIFYDSENQDIHFIDAVKMTGKFSIYALVFFLLRDILGFGTFTFPSKNGIHEFFLFDSTKSMFFSFFASVPGALMLVALTIVLLVFLQKKFNIVERTESDDIE